MKNGHVSESGGTAQNEKQNVESREQEGEKPLTLALSPSNGERGTAGGNPVAENIDEAKKAGSVGSGRAKRVKLETVVPWPEPVNGADLLDAIVKVLERFVVLPKWAATTIALWIVHTYAFRLREVTTYIGIESPEKECGKSTLLTVLSRFVNRPAVSSNISPSAFFRVIEDLEPTLLMDEGDTSMGGRDELTGIFNAGYTKSTAFVWRISYDPGLAEEEAEEGEQKGSKGDGSASAGYVTRYSTWCPKAIARIGAFDPTLASRCIVIRMHRKAEGEEAARLKFLDTTELKRKCARFVADHAEEIASADPAIPAGLMNRAADIWEPLLVLADLAGGHWPQLSREAAIGLTVRSQEQSPIGALLLDIFLGYCLSGRERLFSRHLVDILSSKDERPWAELRRGKALNETWLAQQLRPYGIRPHTMRVDGLVGKGYALEDFKETFHRYIPKADKEALSAELEEMREANAEKLKDKEESESRSI